MKQEGKVKQKTVKLKRISYSTSRRLNALLFISPWLVGFIVFFIMPMFNTILYSFNSVSVAEEGGIQFEFTGIQNYIDLFRTEVSSRGRQFARVFLDENINIFVNTPLIVIFSLFLAILINMKYKGRSVVRVIFFLPIVLGIKVVTNHLMISTGGDIVDAAVDSVIDNTRLMNVLISYTFLPVSITRFMSGVVSNIFNLISQSGVQTLIFLAGLQSINPSLYEVAKIESANSYDVFWKITLPLLSNVTLFVLIYTFVDLFLASPITKEIYTFAFKKNNIGIGSALSAVYMFNILLDLGILILLLRSRKGGVRHSEIY
ncbi:MAG: sugar ABC transporter permease [Firmicutes bacterium]|nr:sugar ABC transporter permease [Bacillota bacterium]